MNQNKIINKIKDNLPITLITLVALVVLGIMFIFLSDKNSQDKVTESTRNNNAKEEIISSPPELLRSYEKKMAEILKPYFKQENFDDILDQLTDIKVPYEYRVIHLDLVIAFDKIKEGQDYSDQSLIEEGMAKINNISGQYPWLK